jgi:hypothetical protein
MRGSIIGPHHPALTMKCGTTSLPNRQFAKLAVSGYCGSYPSCCFQSLIATVYQAEKLGGKRQVNRRELDFDMRPVSSKGLMYLQLRMSR